jgi:hypothetical protein
MKYKLNIYFIVVLSILNYTSFRSTQTLAREKSSKSIGKNAEIKGTYLLSELIKSQNGEFKLKFTAVAPSGTFDELTITSKDLHHEVKVNQAVNIIGEYIGKPEKENELSQVLIYLPARGRPTPIWIVSVRHPHQEKSAKKLIEMHAPTTDYQVY